MSLRRWAAGAGSSVQVICLSLSAVMVRAAQKRGPRCPKKSRVASHVTAVSGMLSVQGIKDLVLC